MSHAIRERPNQICCLRFQSCQIQWHVHWIFAKSNLFMYHQYGCDKIISYLFEPQLAKRIFWHVRPMSTQISLHIRIKKFCNLGYPKCTQWMHSLIWIFVGRALVYEDTFFWHYSSFYCWHCWHFIADVRTWHISDTCYANLQSKYVEMRFS